MAKDKMKSEDAVPQADTQAHTEMAEREGQQAGRAGPTDQQGTGREEKGALRTGGWPFLAQSAVAALEHAGTAQSTGHNPAAWVDSEATAGRRSAVGNHSVTSLWTHWPRFAGAASSFAPPNCPSGRFWDCGTARAW
jgi:hypothetical protein